MNSKIDKEYRTDFNYISEIDKFSEKDMLKLALYQEWVKRRYTKPDTKKSIILTLVGLCLGAIALALKIQDTFMYIPAVMFFMAIFIEIMNYYNEQKQEIEKLNAIKDTLVHLSN